VIYVFDGMLQSTAIYLISFIWLGPFSLI